MTVEQASLYKAVTDEVLEQIKKKGRHRRRGLVLKLLTSLKQICNHPAQFLKQNSPLSDRSGKLAAFDEILEGLDGTDESVLVFSQYVQMARLLEQHLQAKGMNPCSCTARCLHYVVTRWLRNSGRKIQGVFVVVESRWNGSQPHTSNTCDSLRTAGGIRPSKIKQQTAHIASGKRNRCRCTA